MKQAAFLILWQSGSIPYSFPILGIRNGNTRNKAVLKIES
nr:MAG TPA: hypothetical protein [Caudoviricetes sp.]